MIDLVVIGAGGFGRETLDVVEAVNAYRPSPLYRLVGVVDDCPSDVNLERLKTRGYRHIGDLASWLSTGDGNAYLVAIGDPSVRSLLVDRITVMPPLEVLVHPSVSMGSQFLSGRGTIICSGVQISTNVKLGEHVHINPGAVIGHDATLDNYVSINPGAIVSGEVHLRDRVLIGAGAVVLQGLTVNEKAVVGASACVVVNVPSNTMVKGVPAR